MHIRAKDAVQTTVLSSGTPVSTFENNRLLSSIVFSFRRGGFVSEIPRGANGLCNLVAEMCFNHGSESYAIDDYFNNRFYFEVNPELESMRFCVAFLRSDLHEVLPLFLDGVFRPRLDDETQVRRALKSVQRNVDEAWKNPAGVLVGNPFATQSVFMDCVRESSFTSDDPFGTPTIRVPGEDEIAILPDFFRDSFAVDSDLSVTALGVDHDDFVGLLDGMLPSTDSPSVEPVSTSGWQGTEVFREFLQPPIAMGKHKLPPCTTAMISFEAPALTHEDCVVWNVIQTLLGGGLSFSAGGPGKGLSSLLYRHFLTQYPFYNMMTSYQPYSESGVFSISALTEHSYAHTLADALVLSSTCLCPNVVGEIVTDADLEGAKNRLAATVMRDLEENLNLNLWMSEDLMNGEIELTSAAVMEMISQVSLDDAVRCWSEAVGAPSIGWAAIGDLTNIPPLSSIQEVLQHVREKSIKFW